MKSPFARHIRRSSGDLDPYSAAHIYYGPDREVKRFKSRAYSSVWPAVSTLDDVLPTDYFPLQVYEATNVRNLITEETRPPTRRASLG